VITRETYDKIQAQIAANKNESLRNNQQADPGLVRAGYIFCGICGRIMKVFPARRPSKTIYQCKKRLIDSATDVEHNHRTAITLSVVDAAVKKKIAEALRQPKLIRQNVEALRKEIKPPTDPMPIRSGKRFLLKQTGVIDGFPPIVLLCFYADHSSS
jgi:site-specific DNA recombinase